MNKPRLFICGDSWTQYDYYPSFQRWPSYLETHYQVYNFGMVNMDNISIIYQLGNLPKFKKGDRLIIVFTEPSRVHRKYFVKNFEEHKHSWIKMDSYDTWNNTPDYFNKIKVNQSLMWDCGFRNDEISFYINLKKLLNKYNPVFTTWSDSFYKKTKDFVELLDVSTIADEGGIDDSHPGILGNYQIYCKIMRFLGNDNNLEEIRNYSII